MKSKRIAISLVMLWIVSISFPMEKEEVSSVEGASYCSIQFPDGRKVRVFYDNGSLIIAGEKSVAELLQEGLCIVVRLKNKDREMLKKLPKVINSKEDLDTLKQELASMLDQTATIPTFLSSSERLRKKNAVIWRGCTPS